MSRETAANWLFVGTLLLAWLPMMAFIPGTTPFSLAMMLTGTLLAAAAGYALASQRTFWSALGFHQRMTVTKIGVVALGTVLLLLGLTQLLTG